MPVWKHHLDNKISNWWIVSRCSACHLESSRGWHEEQVSGRNGVRLTQTRCKLNPLWFQPFFSLSSTPRCHFRFKRVNQFNIIIAGIAKIQMCLLKGVDYRFTYRFDTISIFLGHPVMPAHTLDYDHNALFYALSAAESLSRWNVLLLFVAGQGCFWISLGQSTRCAPPTPGVRRSICSGAGSLDPNEHMQPQMPPEPNYLSSPSLSDNKAAVWSNSHVLCQPNTWLRLGIFNYHIIGHSIKFTTIFIIIIFFFTIKKLWNIFLPIFDWKQQLPLLHFVFKTTPTNPLACVSLEMFRLSVHLWYSNGLIKLTPGHQ